MGGVILGIGLLLLSTVPFVERDPDSDSAVIIITSALGCFVGATIGAAAGATIAQKRSSRRSSFWRALLGAVVGMGVGVPCALTGFGILAAPILIVAGAVIGSGWKAKPAEAVIP